MFDKTEEQNVTSNNVLDYVIRGGIISKEEEEEREREEEEEREREEEERSISLERIEKSKSIEKY